jgi:hypothetical protein
MENNRLSVRCRIGIIKPAFISIRASAREPFFMKNRRQKEAIMQMKPGGFSPFIACPPDKGVYTVRKKCIYIYRGTMLEMKNNTIFIIENYLLPI